MSTNMLSALLYLQFHSIKNRLWLRVAAINVDKHRLSPANLTLSAAIRGWLTGRDDTVCKKDYAPRPSS